MPTRRNGPVSSNVRPRMDDLTAGDIWKKQEEIERNAATLLGQMLFEFARLETGLSLCVVWLDEGKRLEALTKQIAGVSFHKKIEVLENFISTALPTGSKRHQAYATWIEQVNAARQQRNELVHGRWGVDGTRECVVNVIGIPTSTEQREVHYTLDELKSILTELQRLQKRLSQLRSNWPL